MNLQISAADEIAATFSDGLALDLVQEGDFADAVALMSCLDAVITVDTATAHVASALGMSGMVLPSFADWRWFTDREQCLFYPSLRLARQQNPSDLDELCRRRARNGRSVAAAAVFA